MTAHYRICVKDMIGEIEVSTPWLWLFISFAIFAWSILKNVTSDSKYQDYKDVSAQSFACEHAQQPLVVVCVFWPYIQSVPV